MTENVKNRLAQWLPLIITLLVSLLGNAALLGYYQGETKNELRNLRETDSAMKAEMMPMDKRLEVFYTRREAQTLETLIRDTNLKVDAIYQREMSKK
jgi:hypothetical protein